MIDAALLEFSRRAQARRATPTGSQPVYARPATFRRKDDELAIHGPRDLLDAVIAAGRKGVSCSATRASAR